MSGRNNRTAPVSKSQTAQSAPAEGLRIYRYRRQTGVSVPDGVLTVGVTVETQKNGDLSIQSPRGARLAVVNNQIFPDLPGSSDITVKVAPAVGFTLFVGLRFQSDCSLNIWKDGTIEVDRVGLTAKGEDGQAYVSRRVDVDGREAIVMVEATAQQSSRRTDADVSRRYKWISRARSGFVLDAPGSKNIMIAPGKGVQQVEYAGMKFTEQITASIKRDGTLLVTKEGIVGRDEHGRLWQSISFVLDDEAVIGFFPSTQTDSLSPQAGGQGTKPTLLPPIRDELFGTHPVRIRNPNDFAVTAGIRKGQSGKDVEVPANGVRTAYVPNGSYNIYFVYSDRPDALFQGDSFNLSGHGVEIQIVKVVGGNYGIRQVK